MSDFGYTMVIRDGFTTVQTRRGLRPAEAMSLAQQLIMFASAEGYRVPPSDQGTFS